MLLVGLPVLGLLGILEAGRTLAAPPSIAGEWTLEFGSVSNCAALGRLRQPALTISQSGASALITLNDGHASTLEATINGPTLTAKSLTHKSLTAAIAGKAGERVLDGRLTLEGCAPASFRAARRAPSTKPGS